MFFRYFKNIFFLIFSFLIFTESALAEPTCMDRTAWGSYQAVGDYYYQQCSYYVFSLQEYDELINSSLTLDPNVDYTEQAEMIVSHLENIVSLLLVIFITFPAFIGLVAGQQR